VGSDYQGYTQGPLRVGEWHKPAGFDYSQNHREDSKAGDYSLSDDAPKAGDYSISGDDSNSNDYSGSDLPHQDYTGSQSVDYANVEGHEQDLLQNLS